MLHSANSIRFPITPYQAYYLNPYNNSQNRVLTSIYELRGENIVNRLESAWKKLCSRHESLRLSFCRDGNDILQIINGNFPILINYYSDKVEISLEEIIANYSAPFNLQQAPLFRISLFHRGENFYWMLFEIHHAVLDGISSMILFNDLFTALEARPLTELNSSYSDYNLYLHHYLSSERFQAQKKYWESKLLSKPIEFVLPKDNLMANLHNPVKKPEFVFSVTAEQSVGIDSFIVANKITKYVFFAGIFSLLLHDFSGCEEVVYVSAASPRLQEQYKEVVAALVNFIVFRFSVSQEDNLNLFFKKTFKEIFAAMANMEYPFTALKAKIIAPQPVDGIFFIYHNHVANAAPVLVSQDGKTSFGFLHTQSSGGARNLRLEVVELGKTYLCKLSYNPNLFEHETISKLSTKFQVLVNFAITSNYTSISQMLQAAS